MNPCNELRSREADRAYRRSPTTVRAAALAALAVLPACGPDRTSMQQDVRLDVSHETPASLAAGDSVRLDLRVASTPPLPAGAAHVWYSTDGDAARTVLFPLGGTDRLRAVLPPLARGTVLRYRFTVESPLGDEVRLPAGPAAPPEEPGGAPAPPAGAPHYELVARAPIAPWAAWLRGGGVAVATLLVVGGALLALRESTAGRGRAARAWLRLAAAGAVLFGIAVLVGGLAASWQATGDLLRDVPTAWWLALVLWLPLLFLALRARAARALPAPGESAPPGSPGRRTATVAAVLAIGGALAALLGLGGLV